MSSQRSSIVIGDKEISIETGYLAKQADSAVLVKCNEDVVLVAITSAYEPSEQDFFPMTVEYQERFYSAGKIPGGFFKREGRPSQESILSARMIDRPIRPCFPEGYRYDTQVVATILSCSNSFPVDILASLGVSAALHISDLPFSGPTAAIKIIRVDGEFVLNPSPDLIEKSDINLTLAGTKEGILMVEGEAGFVSEKCILDTLKKGHESIVSLVGIQEDLRKKTGSKPKREWKAPEKDTNLSNEVEKLYKDQLLKALTVPVKKERSLALRKLKKEIKEHFNPEDESKQKMLSSIIENLKYTISRNLILQKNVRIDGRQLDEIRPIECQVGILPRTHGSGLFTRGETQVLSTITLGTDDDSQKMDTLSGLSKKRFLLHYNFPPFCVGETGRMGGQSRREIGHGFLAEKALKPILPKIDQFPYTIRVVSEVLESNGSSSMGTVCSGSLALMNAGVPIKKAIAGIAMGLIQEKDKTAILSDILGDEDHLGDMDFKVAGSEDGVSAVQMDIKIAGLSFDIIEKALEQARKGRLHILSCMNKVISESNKEMSPYAPRIETITIHPDKIREVIGSGGKMINSIIQQTGVKIDIEDNGVINLASSDSASIQKAKDIIDQICEDVEVGKTYEGPIKKLVEFGAFVEILPNTTGLLHISEIMHKRVNKVEDVLEEGQTVKVKVMDAKNGRIRLSMKALEEKS